MTDTNDRLIVLYQDISDHSRPVCSGEVEGGCMVPYSCCDKSVCLLVIEQAKWDWNVELPQTGHAEYPLMGPDGCTAPPHMRPLCSMHVCCINGNGFKNNDPKWTGRYYELRDEIERLEFEKRYPPEKP